MKFRLLKRKYNLKSEIKNIKSAIRPYKDVLIFMVTLLVTNYFWKFTVTGDESGGQVTWFGLDITAPFVFMAEHISNVVYHLVALLRDTVHLNNYTNIRYDSGYGVSIVWGCTALKQSFIWLCLMLTVAPAVSNQQSAISNQQSAIINHKLQIRSLWLRKLWFIPLGWLCCYGFNIFRIFVIALLMEHHPAWFGMLHTGFKYLFYAMLFGLWVWFVEKIRPSAQTSND